MSAESETQGRRFKWIAGLVLLVLGFMLLIAWWVMPRRTPAFPESAYDRIQLGMSRKEVEAVIGVPPGNHRLDADSYIRTPNVVVVPVYFVLSSIPGELVAKEGQYPEGGLEQSHDWLEETYRITVEVDRSGKVVGKAKYRMDPSNTDPTWLRWIKQIFRP